MHAGGELVGVHPASDAESRRERQARRSVVRLLAGAMTVLAVTVLSVIAALRRDTYDTGIYRDYFRHCQGPGIQWSFYDDQNFELGFQLITRAIATCTEDPRVYFFVLTLLGLACTVRAARLFGVLPFAVLLYFAASLYPLLFLVQMRQGLANCLGFLGLALYTRGRMAPAWGLLLVAITVHASAILLLLMLICDWMWRHARTTLGVWLVIVVGAICASKAVLYSMSWSRVVYYLDNPEFNQSADVLRISTLKYLGLAVAAGWLAGRKKQDVIRPLVVVCAAAVIIRLVFADNAAFSGRLGASLTFGEIFLLPWLLRYLGRGVAWISLSVISAVSAYYLLFIEHPEILILY